MTHRFRASVPLTDDWAHFDFAVADGVATVTLNRPEKLNPLTFESYADLRDLVLQLPYRDDVRVLVIRGEGKGFCAGGDVNEIIGELIRMRPRELMGFTKMTGDLIRAMREVPVPIIAGIQGIAAGAGAVVALASDFRVFARSARIAFLFVTRELDMPLGAAMELDAMTQALLMTTDDHAEFHAAFNERRPPNWTGS